MHNVDALNIYSCSLWVCGLVVQWHRPLVFSLQSKSLAELPQSRKGAGQVGSKATDLGKKTASQALDMLRHGKVAGVGTRIAEHAGFLHQKGLHHAREPMFAVNGELQSVAGDHSVRHSLTYVVYLQFKCSRLKVVASGLIVTLLDTQRHHIILSHGPFLAACSCRP
jgi:hypothetical protein